MKSYKLLALVALASIFMLNVAAAQNEVTLTREGDPDSPYSGSTLQSVSERAGIQNGDVFTINANQYTDNGYLNLSRKSITIKGASGEETIVGVPETSFIYSDYNGLTASTVTLSLEDFSFKKGGSGSGGFASFKGDDFVVTGKNVTISDCFATSQGGAFYFGKNATFSGTDASITFSNNTADDVNNDIYCAKDLLFTGSGTYTLNGGIETGANSTLTIESPTVIFGSGAVNTLTNLNINGPETKVTFAEGTTTLVGGTTTIENTGSTTNGDSEESNIQFAGKEDFVRDVDIVNSKVDFSGKETFSNVTVSNGSDVDFSGENSASGTVIIKDTATKAHFDGAQQLSKVQITNRAKAEASKDNAFTKSDIVVDDFGEFDINEVFNSDNNSSLTVGNNGVVNMLWADDADVTGFGFNGSLTVNDGGNVYLSNNTGNLNIQGTLDGEAAGALNLAIMKSALTADSATGLYGVTGNTLTVKSLGSGSDYIDLITSDFAYHDESQMFELINLTNGQLTLGDFLQAVPLPFSWCGAVSPDEFTYVDQDLSATGSKFYIFKIDGDKVPEPSTWALMILGVAGLYFVRRKNSAK